MQFVHFSTLAEYSIHGVQYKFRVRKIGKQHSRISTRLNLKYTEYNLNSTYTISFWIIPRINQINCKRGFVYLRIQSKNMTQVLMFQYNIEIKA